MVQIIQAGPSEATLRQQALNEGLQQAIQGYAAYDKKKKDDALTLRQQALQDRLEARQTQQQNSQDRLEGRQIQQQNFSDSMALNNAGIASPLEDVRAYANGTYNPKEISPAQAATPAQYGKELQGPVMPGQDPLREVFSRGKEAVPAVMGNANPLTNYTEAKRAQIKAASEKAKLETESQQADINYKKTQTANMEAESPYKAQKIQAEINKINSDANLSPITRRKLLADAQKAEAEAGKITMESSGKGVAGARLSKMSAEAQSKVGALASGLKALKDVGASMDQGYGPEYINPDTPMIGRFQSDTPFTKAQRVVSEVTGRLQSGGAIGAQEMENFNNMGPRPGDAQSVAKGKLKDQMSFLENKLTAFGFKENDLRDLGFDVGKSQGGKISESDTQDTMKQVQSMTRADKIKILQGGA